MEVSGLDKLGKISTSAGRLQLGQPYYLGGLPRGVVHSVRTLTLSLLESGLG